MVRTSGYLDVSDPKYGREFAFINFVIFQMAKSEKASDRNFKFKLIEVWDKKKVENDGKEWPPQNLIDGVRLVMSEFDTREQDFAVLYGSGNTLEEIGVKHSVSKERVRQILMRVTFQLNHYTKRHKMTEGLAPEPPAKKEKSKNLTSSPYLDYVTIDKIGYSENVYNALCANGFKTIEDIVKSPKRAFIIAQDADKTISIIQFHQAILAYHVRKKCGSESMFFAYVLKKIDNVRDIPICWAPFSNRVFNILVRNQFFYVGDLELVSFDDLNALRGAGKTIYFSVFTVMSSLGLYGTAWSDAALESVGVDRTEWEIVKKNKKEGA